jgi:hypothetical protein
MGTVWVRAEFLTALGMSPGTYSYNHNNRTIILLLALLLWILGFDSNDTQVSDLLEDPDMICK